jgi:molecular chaperone GrpE (heat shock protein)
MSDASTVKLARWPALFFFLLGDALFLGLAWWIMSHAGTPLALWDTAALVLCVGAGAWLSILPFLWDHQAAIKLTESDKLASTLAQVQNLEQVAAQVTGAGAQIQGALDEAARTVTAANEISARMTAEAKAFAEFMQKANDIEKAHLRLEAEKLRRAEGEWIQIVVRMLDHTFALHQAAARSGQQNVAQQLANFQTTCHDSARRVGLVPFAAAPGAPFDAARHRLVEENAEAPANAAVGETLAPGFTYQGQLLRPALVSLQSAAPPAETAEISEAPAAPEEQRLL